MEDGLFPALPEDLKAAKLPELQELLKEHEEAARLIDADDADFLKDLSADEVIAQFKVGVDQIKILRGEIAEHETAYQAYLDEKAKLTSEITAEDDAGDEEEDDGAVVEAPVEVVAEEEEVEEVEEEKVLVTASADNVTTTANTASVVRFTRTPPAPAPERVPVVTAEAETGASLVAAGGFRGNYPNDLDHLSFAHLQKEATEEYGPMPKTDPWGTYRVQGPHGDAVFDGPRVKTAKATFEFDGDHTLTGHPEDDIEKIRNVLPATVKYMGQSGGLGGEALVASGGLCAPLTPIYSMPNFGTEAEPVWDSLPVFRAARGGVNTPEATTIGDIETAISSISESDDALGGTFATKSCQDLTCPPYTEVAVQILAHCREYGNLNARAWPEKIAHENALTMQALSRTSEDFMLERIKALSINVTDGLETLGALIYLVDAIVRSAFGIRGRLRMPAGARFRALLPSYALDLLVLDTIQTQFDRFRSKEELNAYLRSVGIDPVYYIDGNFAAGDDQLPDASQAAGALDGLPNTIQWALFPEGTFLGIDSGSLELGIVRDSTLNSTNDFQVFGERFRNLARIGPAEAAHWHTTDWCPVGQFPPAGTARVCE